MPGEFAIIFNVATPGIGESESVGRTAWHLAQTF
jgi:hypothetical protein